MGVKRRSIAIIGSGPSALMLAATLDPAQFDITIYERNFAPARKFLVAGDGGFNLTHSEPATDFVPRYTPASFLAPAFNAFDNIALRNWLLHLGIETYVGSSKRVFPVKGIKPITVLNAILDHLEKKGVRILTNHTWTGWNGNAELSFQTKEGAVTITPGITVFALGGGSWAKTGSDGRWLRLFEKRGIHTIPLRASNCAYAVSWSPALLEACEGKPLKNIRVSCNGIEKNGELVITRLGLEGGAVYALSPQIRKHLDENGSATLLLDLKPALSADEINSHLTKNKKRSRTKILEEDLKLSKTQIALLKSQLHKDEFISTPALVKAIKGLSVTITSTGPIDEAISTVGGIALEEVDGKFQLKKIPGTYVIGEMLDWDAPTGGYLLQGCFSMGRWLGEKLNEE
jgi:uncharacterized flavoprotein (TIGR03862 family)